MSLGQRRIELAKGTLVGELAAMVPEAKDAVVARVDNDVMGYQFALTEDCWVEFLNTNSEEGMRAYRASLVFLFVRAALEVLPGSTVHIQHSLNNGLYGEIEYEEPVIERDIMAIEERMRELVAQDIPFGRRTVPVDEAKRIYAEQGFADKLRLLEQYTGEAVTLYNFGWLHDYLSSILVAGTGVLQHFKLRYYLPGFILEYPRRHAPSRIQKYVEQGKLFNVFF